MQGTLVEAEVAEAFAYIGIHCTNTASNRDAESFQEYSNIHIFRVIMSQACDNCGASTLSIPKGGSKKHKHS